jgi:hypothetical protein
VRGSLAAAAVAALLAVTGCAGVPGKGIADTVPTATTASSAHSTSTLSTPAPLSQEQAARRYLAIVKPYNIALERLEQAINTGRPMATVRTLAAEVASANAAHMRELRATLWPMDVRAPVRELLAESAQAQVHWRRAAQATTRSGLVQAVLQAVEHDGTQAAGRIRRRLDLSEYDERDYP